METNNITISDFADLKKKENIETLERGSAIKILFDDVDEAQREEYGEYLKVKYPDYLIGVHISEKEINVSRLISKKEIDDNIVFFTKCAEDYDALCTRLMNLLIQKMKIDVNYEFPFLSFASLGSGHIDDWSYRRHGFHCCFTHQKTKQCVQASIVCGDQFGELDPYFFSAYILSSDEYLPLSIPIYEQYHDGQRILERMEELDILKSIESNWSDRYTYVLANKDTSHIRPYAYPKTEEKKNGFRNFLKNIIKK